MCQPMLVNSVQIYFSIEYRGKQFAKQENPRKKQPKPKGYGCFAYEGIGMIRLDQIK
jgi:hypothetical protein